MELVMVGMPPQVAVFGEAMLELNGSGLGQQGLSYGGDTLNMAIGLARLGVPTTYVTALGDDPFSDALLAGWQAEGLGTALVNRGPGLLPGLYAIQTDAAGERRFHYWRKESAARRFFRLPGVAPICEALVAGPWIVTSGITLAILDGADREALMGLLVRARRQGTRIAFDPNIRMALWSGPAEARAALDRVWPLVDIALPTFVDELALFGDPDPDACAARLLGLGVPEVVVKLGSDGCLVATADGSWSVPPPQMLRPVDSSGAGDAFNAGYLAARLRGVSPRHAAVAGHRMAAITLAHRGAIPPRTAVDPAQVLA